MGLREWVSKIEAPPVATTATSATAECETADLSQLSQLSQGVRAGKPEPHPPDLSQLSQLSQPFGDTEREAFEERAAIMEYDGGLSREEAERRADDGFAARCARAREGQASDGGEFRNQYARARGATAGNVRGELSDQYARAREATEPPASEAVRADEVSAHIVRAHAREGDGAALDKVSRSVEARAWPLDAWGDLRPCTRCRNLLRSGRCLAAWNGLLRASRDYEPPIPAQPHRCIGYAPPGDDPDQRPGLARWPELAEWQARPRDCGGPDLTTIIAAVKSNKWPAEIAHR